MKWTFVIPPPDLFPTGGNIYNRNMIDALNNQGEQVEICPIIDPFNPKSADIFVWDTLYIDAMMELDIQSYPGRHIMLVHHLESMYPGPSSVFDQMERKVLDKMDGFWVTSEFSKRYLLNRYLDGPIWVLPPIFNGPVKKTPVKKDNLLQILIASNLVERKGILPFLKLLGSKQHLGNFSISITGSHDLEPEYATSCIQYVDSCWLKHQVIFLGPIQREEVFTLYQEADLYISPSFFETFGMSIQEALYYGTPVLCIDGGNTSFLVGASGWCVEDTKTLMDQFEQLLINPDQLRQKEVDYSNWVKDWDEAARYIIKQLRS